MNDSVKCYCISLLDNHEQRKRLTRHLNKVGIQVEYFTPTKSPLGGRHGCHQSHLESTQYISHKFMKYICLYKCMIIL